ncbi:recombinase family protein [Altererythrobacter sp. SALINAS58]|uniref:recombinase family protein n=1 Tax=Alteripontixanthobacter muriae TaxID=2705546 RepID=UPI0015764264|nr:recombinase family protein [Alteripontixanthobacter muriae]NTZ42157.1 recombinase family protein [Alteripontixanthobacter muriae]
MSRIAYYRVSTDGQSIESQRKALGGNFDKEFADEGVSGATLAADRPAFAALLGYVREGDTVCVTALDRVGRDALDVQSVVRDLIKKGVTIDVLGLGPVAKGVGELVVAVLAQIADMERQRIKERCDAGRQAARASLAANGKTHRGKASLGRPFAADSDAVAQWRKDNGASIATTAQEFGLSAATVKRYCAASAA